jgi:hypothetical protein
MQHVRSPPILPPTLPCKACFVLCGTTMQLRPNLPWALPKAATFVTLHPQHHNKVQTLLCSAQYASCQNQEMERRKTASARCI